MTDDLTIPSALYRRTIWFTFFSGIGVGIIVGYFLGVFIGVVL